METAKRDTAHSSKLLIVNELARESLGGARTGFGSDNAFRTEIAVQRVNGRIQNQVAVGTSLQMALDLDFDGLGEPPL
jgi:hypothetical protein